MRLTMQLRALARPLVRALVWQPVAIAGAAVLVFVDVSQRLGSRPDALLHRLHFGGIAIAAAAAFAMDDPAAATLASSPTPLVARRAHRVAVVAAAVAGGWLLAAGRAGALGASWDRAGSALALELATYLAVALAVAALAAWWTPEAPVGAAGAVAVLGLAIGAAALPGRWAPIPSSPYFDGARARLAIGLAAAVCLLAVASRDPARGKLAG